MLILDGALSFDPTPIDFLLVEGLLVPYLRHSYATRWWTTHVHIRDSGIRTSHVLTRPCRARKSASRCVPAAFRQLGGIAWMTIAKVNKIAVRGCFPKPWSQSSSSQGQKKTLIGDIWATVPAGPLDLFRECRASTECWPVFGKVPKETDMQYTSKLGSSTSDRSIHERFSPSAHSSPCSGLQMMELLAGRLVLTLPWSSGNALVMAEHSKALTDVGWITLMASNPISALHHGKHSPILPLLIWNRALLSTWTQSACPAGSALKFFFSHRHQLPDAPYSYVTRYTEYLYSTGLAPVREYWWVTVLVHVCTPYRTWSTYGVRYFPAQTPAFPSSFSCQCRSHHWFPHVQGWSITGSPSVTASSPGWPSWHVCRLPREGGCDMMDLRRLPTPDVCTE